MQNAGRTNLVHQFTVIFGLLVLMFSTASNADSLVVKPERVNLSSVNPVTEIHFQNTSDEETTLGFDVFQWHQQGEREWHTPSRQLIITPERIVLKAGESGKVDVSLRLTGSFWDEEAYRIMVTRKSRIPDVGSNNAQSKLSRTTHYSSLPVFLKPPGQVDSRLFWSFTRNESGGVVLRATNSGKAHAELNSTSLQGPAGQSIRRDNMSEFILPGGARSWEFPMGVTGGTWELTVQTTAGPVQAQLQLGSDQTGTTTLGFVGQGE